MKAFSLAALILAVSFAAACSSSDSPTDPEPDPGQTPGTGSGGGGNGGGSSTNAPDTIYVNGLSFSPSSLTVSPGDTVIWLKQDGGVVHTVTPQQHSAFARVSSSGTGEMLRVVFSAAGSYPYICEPHLSAGMTGTVIVQ